MVVLFAFVSLCRCLARDESIRYSLVGSLSILFLNLTRPASYFGKLSISHIQAAAPAGIECRSFEQLHEAREWLETVTAA
jgi:hypothetical protein